MKSINESKRRRMQKVISRKRLKKKRRNRKNLYRRNVTNQALDINVNQARDAAEKEEKKVKEMNIEVVHVDENAVGSVAENETSVVHLTIEIDRKTLNEIQTKIVMKVVAVVRLINTAKSHHLALEEIAPLIVPETVHRNVQEMTNLGDVVRNQSHPAKVPHQIATAQMIRDTINVHIIKNRRRSIRRNHPKNMTAPMMTIAITKRKRRKANVKDLDPEDADKQC